MTLTNLRIVGLIGGGDSPVQDLVIGDRFRNEVTKLTEAGFGPRYEMEGELRAPDGRRPRVRTVWQMDEGETAPRLITACPLEKDE